MALDALAPLNVWRQVDRLRRQLLPLPLVDRAQPLDTSVFDPFEARPATALRGKRIGLVGSAAGGAAVALVGVRRAFEEAGIELEAVSACSGSAVWGAMWAAGLSAQEMAEFSLSWRPQDYLDIQWAGLPRFALSALRGFTGLARGEALEHLFDRRLWHMSAGETDVALHTAVYEIERARVRWFGSHETPDLTLGELVRIAAAPPVAAEGVRVEGALYVDGGAVDAFPAEPLIADGGFDRVFGLDFGATEGRTGLAAAQRDELARRSRRRLGESLTLVRPITGGDHDGLAFYDLFLDRRRWADLMRRGYSAAREALAPFRRRRRA